MKTILLTAAGAALSSARLHSANIPASRAIADSDEPCAAISAIKSSEPSSFLYDPDLALACLHSVPVNQDVDPQLVDELKVYLEFQTTLSYLKDPPKGYDNPPVDLMGGMDAIKQNITNGFYYSEYEVQMAIATLLTSAHDGHLGFQSDISSVFSFETRSPLVSASRDGIELPQIYVWEDLMFPFLGGGPSFTPSPVTRINGQDIEEYLDGLIVQSLLHDADARYNDLFYSTPRSSIQGGTFGFTSIGQYAGAWINTTHLHGTMTSFQNVAVSHLDFTGVEDGGSFYSKFCTGLHAAPLLDPTDSSLHTGTDSESPEDEPSAVTTPTPRPTAFGYPYPVVKHSGNAVGGYFLNGTDVAVLSMPTFTAGDTISDVQEYQDVVTTFIQEALKDGKTKLIIDLRGNGGGNTVLGFDTFKQLFPSIEPWGASRFRAHEAFFQIGNLLEPYISDAALAKSDPEMYRYLQRNFTNYNYVATLTENNTDFASWKDYYGPHEFNGDNFTSLTRYNFSDPASTSYFNSNVTGYDNRTKIFSQQPFATENIVMLQDGYCASTCAIISELLKEQAGVRTIAMGGRPQNGPMQGVGGTKGALTLKGSQINAQATLALANLTTSQDQLEELLGTPIGTVANALLPQVRSYTGGAFLGTGLQINAVDNIRDTDVEGQTPLEFVYEAADCRLFYTLSSVVNVTAAWAQVANAAWGNGTCVPDSKSPPSSVTGGQGSDEQEGAAGIVRPGSAVIAFMLAELLPFYYEPMLVVFVCKLSCIAPCSI
ncbi:hypothetical protein EJ05DRAFT_504417 [Pseudovirgaria hyperparasitica]|uniref:Uncharacterized protein n=1 Tax=Pseudovirgaria hyperparasitica TaxID=470096 RepID=A0A6A6VX02_9PEZI|nr:uncharacterized protein EJ05DRAFT_504417 [Pseudovirgaria hyperparasitica]KAF2754326.1 hypothetical protein EJ05DRAFT_504417 [Pseudovirgaria hyperparasitica]